MSVIGLGLDHRLADLRRDGAITYHGWHAAGLTRVTLVAALLSPYRFERAFADAATNATTIRFDLTDVLVAQALQAGGNGFVRHNYTNAELARVLSEPGWFAKAEFVRDGLAVRFENGRFVDAGDQP